MSVLPTTAQTLRFALLSFHREATRPTAILSRLKSQTIQALWSALKAILINILSDNREVIYGRKAFKALEIESLKGYNKNYDVIIFIRWTNNLRRNIYERFLLPRGYRYGILNNQKVLMKKWKKGEGIRAIRDIDGYI